MESSDTIEVSHFAFFVWIMMAMSTKTGQYLLKKLNFYFDSCFTITQVTNRRKIGTLMTEMSDADLDIYANFSLPGGANNDTVVPAFEKYFKPAKRSRLWMLWV